MKSTVISRHARRASLLRILVVMLLLATHSPAFAGQAVGPMFGLHTEPASPRAGQTFVLGLSAMTCFVFWSEHDPLARDVEVSGDVITVTVDYTSPFNGVGCQSGTTRDVEWVIGPFAQGDYVIRVVGYDPLSDVVGEGVDETTVTIGPPAPLAPRVVPATGILGLLGLAATCAVVGLRRVDGAS